MNSVENAGLRTRLMQCGAVSVLSLFMTAVAGEAAAQQVVPGSSPNCPIMAGEAVCEGDMEDGITASPTNPDFDTLTITNPTAPIAPPGYFGIGVVRNTDTVINIADDVVINVFDDPNIGGVAQGLIAIADQGADLTIDTGADITADGNDSFALGIEAVALNGDGNLSITNRGMIDVFTTFESAIAIQGVQQNSTGWITINNSGTLSATSGGAGERGLVTAGILARHDTGAGDINVTNSGAIDVSATTFDTDFTGVAAGIVTNSFGGANTTDISNAGTITSTGQALHGIVGFTANSSVSETANLNIDNMGTLAIDGTDNYGILAQSAGTNVNTTVTNTGAITMANGANSNGLFVLSRADTAALSLSNEGDISGTGTLLRGMGVSTFLAPPGGTYDMLVHNDGDFTLDAAHGLGITVFATREDVTQVDLTNLGNLDLSAATNDLSNGISVNLNQVDPNAGGAVGSSALTLFNGGNITMGSGRGLFLIADDITAENAGAISMANGTGILVQDFDTLSLTNSGAITTTGANSDGIVVDASASDDWGVTVTDVGSITTSGAGSAAIRVTGTTNTYLQNLILEQTARVTVNKAQLADRAMNAVNEYNANGSVAAAPPTLPAAPGTAGGGAGVVVNGTVQSDGGAGAIVSAGALDVAAADPGATIATTGDDAPVISAQGALSLLTSDRLVLSSTGDNSPLFQVLGGGDSAAGAVLIDIDASTTGDNSTAFQLDSGGGDSVGNLEIYSRDAAAPSSITTTGDGSHAVQFDTTATGSSTFTGEVYDSEISTAGNGSMAFNLDLGLGSSANLALADSTVTTGGSASDAVHIGVGDGSDVLLLVERSTISTSGAGSDAIDLPQVANSSIGNAVIIDSNVSTTGDDARGLVFGELGGTTSTRNAFIVNSDVTTEGDGATAILLGAFGNSSLTTTGIDGTTISTAGTNARGINHGLAGDSSATELNVTNTTINTTGSMNAGALVMEGTADTSSAFTVNLADVNFSTGGADSDAIFVGGGGFDNSIFLFDIANANLTTQGDNSRGLVLNQFLASQASTTVADLLNVTVSTAGAGSDGIVIGTSGDGAMVGSSTAFSAAGLDISTAGSNARGLVIDGASGGVTNSDFTLSLMDSTVSTSGDGASGVELFGVGGAMSDTTITVVSEGVDVTTTGAGAHGIVLGALPAVSGAETNDTALALAFGAIDVSGEGSNAISIGAGWGAAGAQAASDAGDPTRLAVMEISEDVSATGAGGNGLITGSLINSLNIASTGSLTGDAFAIQSEGTGGIEALTNAGTITGDILLGDEDSVLTSSGTMTGNVDLGGGANALTIEAGGVFHTLNQVLVGSGNAMTISGDVSPGEGGPVQITSVEGDVVFEAGSRFLVDIDGGAADAVLAGIGASDRLDIDGSATLNGGTVTVSSLTPRTGFDSRTEYQILSATDGVTGMFADLDSNLPFLMLSLQHNADNVRLIAERGFFAPDFATAAQTPNQLAVATTFDTLEDGATGDLAAVIDQLIFSNTDQALTAFDTSSGEIYAAMLAQTVANSAARTRQVLSRSRRSLPEGPGLWTSISGLDGSIAEDGNGAEIERSEYGFDAGLDYAGPGNAWAVGLAAGIRYGDVLLDDRLSNADYESWQIAAYGRYGTGGTGLTASAAATLSEDEADMARRIVVGNFNRRAMGQVTTESLSLAGELRYGFAAGEGFAIGPIASISHASSDLGSFRETGADSLSLISSGSSDEQTGYGGGLFANWQTGRTTLDVSVQYVGGGSNSTSALMAFAGAPDARFNIRAPQQDRTGIHSSVSGSTSIGGNWTVALQADSFEGDAVSDISGSIIIGWKF